MLGKNRYAIHFTSEGNPVFTARDPKTAVFMAKNNLQSPDKDLMEIFDRQMKKLRLWMEAMNE